MIAYLIAGLIVGCLAWYLKHEPGALRLGSQLLFGAVAAVVGGVGMNLVVGADLMALSPWGFAGAAVLALVVLGLLQAGVGRSGDND